MEPASLFETVSAAAATVAESHKCRIDAFAGESGRIRLIIKRPSDPDAAAVYSSMGVALDVCGEAGGVCTPASLFAGFDADTVWLRPIVETEGA
jgi:hypothetical protein